MALLFGTSGDLVNHGSAAGLDNMTALTLWAWVYKTATAGGQQIISKADTFPNGWEFLVEDGYGAGTVQFLHYRGGDFNDATNYVSAAGVVPLNTWTLVAVTYDNALATNKVKLYKGSLSSALTEVTYFQQTDGSGTQSTDDASNVYVGNIESDTTRVFRGRIARGGVVSSVLSVATLETIRKASLYSANVTGTKLLFDYIALGTQTDYSGNSSTGTVTGATLAARPPFFDITTTTLPDAPVDTAYNQPIAQINGVSPYASVTLETGFLPTGLTIAVDNTAGLAARITGTPTGSTAVTSNFKVKIVDANGFIAHKDLSINKTISGGGGGGAAPSIPTGLTGTVISGNQINLSWTASTGTVTGYRVQRATNSTFTQGVVDTDVSGTTSNQTGLIPAKQYFFKVLAKNGSTLSAYSAPIDRTTSAASYSAGMISRFKSSDLSLADNASVNSWVDSLTPGRSYDYAGAGSNTTPPTFKTGAIPAVSFSATLDDGLGLSAALPVTNAISYALVGIPRVKVLGNRIISGSTTDFLIALARSEDNIIFYNGAVVLAESPAVILNQKNVIVVTTGATSSKVYLNNNTNIATANNTATLIEGQPVLGARLGGGGSAATDIFEVVYWNKELTAQEVSDFIADMNVTYSVPIAPSIPTNLSGTVISSSQINLSWSASTGTVTGYRVQRATNDTFTQGVVDIDVSGTTSNQTGLTATTQYYFKVLAKNGNTLSAYSAPIDRTTNAGGVGASVSDPSNLIGNPISTSQISLSWTAPSGVVTSYEVLGATNSAFATGVFTTAASSTSVIVPNLSPSILYYFKVRAVNSGVFSGYSPAISRSTLVTQSVTGDNLFGNWIPLDINDTYYIEVWARAEAVTTCTMGLHVDGTGAANFGYGRFFFPNQFLSTEWTKITGVVGKEISQTTGAATHRRWNDNIIKNDVAAGIGTNSAKFRWHFVNTSTTDVAIFIAQVSIKRQETGNLIVNGAITTAHMTAGSIDAAVILAGSITTSLIQAGAIGADQIAARAIRADKLAIGILSGNLVSNSSFESITAQGININKPAGWALVDTQGTAGDWSGSSDVAADGSFSLKINSGSTTAIGHQFIPVVAGEKYSVRFKIKSSGSSGTFSVLVQECNSEIPSGKAFIGNSAGGAVDPDVYQRSGFSSLINSFDNTNQANLAFTETLLQMPLTNINGGWNGTTNETGVWNIKEAVYTAPIGVKFINLSFYNNNGNADLYVDAVILQKQIRGVTIEDGTIRGINISADSISGLNIQGDTIRARHLIVGGFSDNLVVNPSFEQVDSDQLPETWAYYNSAGLTTALYGAANSGRYATLPPAVSPAPVKGAVCKIISVTPATRVAFRIKLWTSIDAQPVSLGFLFRSTMPPPSVPPNPRVDTHIGNGTAIDGLPVYDSLVYATTSFNAGASYNNFTGLTTTPTYFEGVATVPVNCYWMCLFISNVGTSSVFIDEVNVKAQTGDVFISDLRADKLVANVGEFGLVFSDQIRQKNYTPYQLGSINTLATSYWKSNNAANLVYDYEEDVLLQLGTNANWTQALLSQKWQKIEKGTNGYIECTYREKVAQSHFIFGLVPANKELFTDNVSENHRRIEYGFYVNNAIPPAANNLLVWEGNAGQTYTEVGIANEGDILRVAVEDGYVKYRKNGKVVFVSVYKPAIATASYVPATPDPDFVNPDFRGCITFFGTQVKIKSLILVQGGYGDGWRLNPLSGKVILNEEPIWTFPVGEISFPNGTIIKASGADAWSASAVSEQEIGSGDGWVQASVITPATTNYAMIGLSNSVANWGSTTLVFESITHAIFVFGYGIRIYESGVLKTNSANEETHTDHAIGDVFRVAIEGNYVKYRKNGAVFYQSALVQTPTNKFTYPFKAKVAIFKAGEGFANVKFDASSSGAGEFNSGISVRGEPLDKTVDLLNTAIRRDSRYKGNDKSNPSIQVSSIVIDTYHADFEDNMAYVSVSMNVNDYKTNPTKNLDSARQVRARVYNKFGTKIKEVTTAWTGRGTAFAGYIPRLHADPYQEAVFSFEIENLYGFSAPIYFTRAEFRNTGGRIWYNLLNNEYISTTAPQYISPIATPSNCVAKYVTTTSVKVTWAKSSFYTNDAHQVYYRVHKPDGYITGGWIAFGGAVTTGTIIVTDLQQDTRYEFMVQVSGVVSAWSNIGYCRTPAIPAAPPTYGVPTNVGVASATQGQLDISWTTNSSGGVFVDTRIHYVAGVGTPDAASLSLTSTGTSISHTGLANNATYSYRLRNAYAGAVFSDWTPVVTQTTFNPAPAVGVPTNVTATGFSYYRIRANWTSNGGSSFKVQLDYSGGNFASPLAENIASTAPSDFNGLASGTDYQVRVSADNGANWSQIAYGSTRDYEPQQECIDLDTEIIYIDNIGTQQVILAKNVVKGLRLLCIDPINGKKVIGSVKNAVLGETNEVYTIKTTSNHTLICSPSHPLIRGFGDINGTSAKLLNVDDVLLVYNAEKNIAVESKIESINIENKVIPVITYEMDSREHTFISGGIVSHNVIMK